MIAITYIIMQVFRSTMISVFVGTTLKEVKQKYAERTVKASKGSDSNQRCILGKCGKNHVVYVPVGLNVVDSQYRLIGKGNL